MSLSEDLQALSKRDFLNKLLRNVDNVWEVALLKIAVDCSEDLEQKIEKLTLSIDKARGSSTLVGIGLILVGAGTWALFLIEICKTFWAK